MKESKSVGTKCGVNLITFGDDGCVCIIIDDPGKTGPLDVDFVLTDAQALDFAESLISAVKEKKQ